MKNKIVCILCCMLLFSSVTGIISFSEASNKSSGEETTWRDFTHTVFAEFGSKTTCPYCKYAHAALKSIYASGDYSFYYVSLVGNKNSIAYDRLRNDYNFYGYPTVWFDGGYAVRVGGGSGNEGQYKSSINSCGSRAVYDVDIDLNVSWLGGTEMEINVSVDNHEASTYDGTIRVYITEITSSMGWKDTDGKIYTFPFLDYAFNETISISAGGTWGDSTTWDGSAHGYGSITEDNIMVIAAVFNDEWHQGYSYPPSQNPFDAYYVDDTVGFRVGDNRPPNTPSNPNPNNGEIDTNITIDLSWTGGDPDWFDGITYDVYFEVNDSTPDVLVSDNQTETSYDPGILECNMTYYWQIIAEDEYGLTTEGPVWHFTTKGDSPPIVTIINPRNGYFHFSGIPLFPTLLNLLADTASLGGFRIRPLQVEVIDDFDDSQNLSVNLYLNEEFEGVFCFNKESGYHQYQWIGPALGIFLVNITAEDQKGNIGSVEIEVWYFCFIPERPE